MSTGFDVLDVGRTSYGDCYQLQMKLVEAVLKGGPDTLVLVEHDPVLTLGANFHPQNLLLPLAEYERLGIEVVRSDRGGDVTFHGPGQLVAYPVFGLEHRDLHRWLRDLEEAAILTLGEFGVRGRRFAPHTGVWVDDRKIAAIGIKVRKWVSFHGVALNCDNDLSPFGLIVPCGIEGYGVTSLSQEAGRRIGVEDAKAGIVRSFCSLAGSSGCA